MGPGGDTEKLNQVDKEPRLTGPGAKAAKQSQAVKMTKDVLGRNVRKR
jgi:hypothetical protein